MPNNNNEKKFSLKNDRLIKIDDKNEKERKQNKSKDIWRTSVSVPSSDQYVLLDIDLKLKELGLPKFNAQDKWHSGLLLFKKLLDYVESGKVNKNMDIEKYLEYLIDSKFNE